MLVTPWITRLYTPVEFGVFGVFFAVVMTLALVASGRYELAIPVASDDDEAAGSLAVSLVVLPTFTVIIGLIGFVIWSASAPAAPMAFIAIGICFVLSAGVFQSFSYWMIRKETYTALSASRIVLAVVAAAVSVIGGYASLGAVGLAIGAAAGQAAGALVAAVLSWRTFSSAWTTRSWSRVIELAGALSEFPLVNAPHALLDGVRETGFQAVFASVFGARVNGFYSLGARVLRAPTSMVGSAVGQVLFSRFSKDWRRGEGVRELVMKVVKTLSLISAGPFILVMLFGPQLFAFVFGPDWGIAGTYAAIMVPGLWATFVIAPLATLPVVAGHIKGAFRFAVADLVMRALALMVGITLGSPEAALIVLSIGGVAVAGALLWWYSMIALEDAAGTRVVFVGQARWCNVLAEQMSLGRSDSNSATYAAVPLERPWSAAHPSMLGKIARADVIVRVGFRPEGETPYARIFEAAWRLLMALRPKARVVMYWIGTDVLRTQQMLNRGVNARRFHRAAKSMIHIAGSSGLSAELAEMGVDARVAWFPALTLRQPVLLPGYPDRFTVLSYVPDARHEFYGGESLLSLARARPDILVRIVGGDGRWAESVPPNVEFCGWVEDMGEQYARSTLVVRLAAHDALGATAIEGLMYGRFVCYSSPLRYAQHVPFGDTDKLIDEVDRAFEFWTNGATPDTQRAAWAAAEFSQSARLEALGKILGGLDA